MATTIGELNEPLRLLVRGFLDRYPDAQPQDLYRMIHEGACGYENKEAPDGEAIAQMAEGAPTDIELVERISVEDTLVRVHLGPYVASGGDLAALAAAAQKSVEEFEPRRDLMFTLWGGFVHMNRRHEFRMDKNELDHFEMRVASAGYPTIAASKTWVDSYDARYVLVLSSLVPDPAQQAD